MTGSSALVCEGVDKHFGDVQALVDVSVTLSAPATALLGANGAGKSTLMKVALGLLRPDAGRVAVLGLDTAHDAAEIRYRVGYMPEHACLPTDMSAQDVCIHFARLRGLGRRDAVRRASEVLFAVGLEEERHRQVGTYSLGMRQRTKLAQALVHGPELVVLDEPTSGLDPAGRRQMLDIVRHVSRDLGISVLLSSHVLADVEATCDEVVVLAAGHVTAQQPVMAQRDTSGVLLELLGDAAGFVAALQRRDVAASQHDARVLLPRSTPAVLTAVRDVAAETGTGLLSMVEASDALEDAIVEAMA